MASRESEVRAAVKERRRVREDRTGTQAVPPNTTRPPACNEFSSRCLLEVTEGDWVVARTTVLFTLTTVTGGVVLVVAVVEVTGGVVLVVAVVEVTGGVVLVVAVVEVTG